MRVLSQVGRWVTLLGLCGASVFAQSVISARSGMVHYVQGRVFIGDQQVQNKFGSFPEIKEGQVLRTEAGRAEILLTPGVFLRVAENSSFRMLSSRLIDTRLEFLSGSAVLEADDLPKDNSVTVVYKAATIQMLKKGLYRFDSEPAELRVVDGEAKVAQNSQTVTVKRGKLVSFDDGLAMAKFDRKTSDALSRWSARRAEYIAMANISAARELRLSGFSLQSNSWAWNPYFGMLTFMPMRGQFYSPYGYTFWSPYSVYQVYMPRVYYAPSLMYGGSRGYSTVPQTRSGYSGTMAVSAPSVRAPTPTASGASSAPISRGGGGHVGGRR